MPSTRNPNTVSKPGGVLSALNLDFIAETSPADWTHFLQELGLRNSQPDNSDSAQYLDFAALPQELSQTSYYLHGNVHHHSPSRAHWRLYWEFIPNADPPEYLRKASVAVGGYDKFISAFVTKWPASRDVKAHAKASYYLLTKRWKSRLIGRPLGIRRILSNDVKLQAIPRMIEFDIAFPDKRIKTVRQGFIGKNLFELQATREIEFALQTAQGLLNCEDVIWQELRHLIQEMPPTSS